MKNFFIKLISCFISILLTMSLFITILNFVVGLNLNGKSFNKHIASSGYNDIVSKKIIDRLHKYAKIAGLPYTVFDEFANSKSMPIEIYEYIKLSKENKNYLYNLEHKKNLLTTKIKEYVNKNNGITDTQQSSVVDSNIAQFVNQSIEVYKNGMQSNVLIKFIKYINMIDRYFIYSVLAVIVVDCLLIFLLIKIQSWNHRGIRYTLYSFIASEIMILMFIILIVSNNMIDRITVMSQGLYNLITSILNACLNTLYISAVVLACLIVIISLIYAQKKEKVS